MLAAREQGSDPRTERIASPVSLCGRIQYEELGAAILGRAFPGAEIGPMKSFVRLSFFRVFDLLLSTSNPGLKRAR
jgi:hypothetical protein